jgi:hypothetical protein
VLFCMRERERPQLFSNQAGETFVEAHAQGTDALRPESTRCGEHKIGAIGFE